MGSNFNSRAPYLRTPIKDSDPFWRRMICREEHQRYANAVRPSSYTQWRLSSWLGRLIANERKTSMMPES